MPFGKKPDVGGRPLDFDKVYKDLIKPPLKALNIECVRCDEIEKPGLIHKEMIEHIYRDDIAVVDITTLNANVFYELGVRHALRAAVTVLIRKKDTKIPFNIQGLKVIDYDLADRKSVEATKRKIGDFIRNGLMALNGDSLVHEVLPLRVGVVSRVIRETRHYVYSLVDNPDKSIQITTGDIQNIKNIDIWVNSENTNMEMARFNDCTVSSVIRYLGAKKNEAGLVVKDIIADELARKVDGEHSVPAAAIIVTTSGHLSRTHSVKRIFHAASVAGEIGRGFAPIPNIADCITNALRKADSPELESAGLTSILFPLMGTGMARGHLREIVSPLINAAIEYLRSNRSSRVRRVHFMAFTEDELAACQQMLDCAPAVRSSDRSATGRPTLRGSSQTRTTRTTR